MAPLRQKVTGTLGSLLEQYVRHRPVEVSQRLDALRSLVARSRPELFATEDLTRFEAQVFSQNGEDGVLIELLNRLGPGTRFFVEFGIQSGHQGNCVLLADVFGWAGLFLEADGADFAVLESKYAGSGVRTARAMVRPDNVEQLFAEHQVPNEPDVLSIDIDGNDFWVWRAIDRYRPRIVVIEYNGGLDPADPIVQPLSERGWDGTGGYGSSLAALDLLAEQKGYQRVHTELAGVNAFYVRQDLLSWDASSTPARSANFGLTGGGHRPATPPGGWQRPFGTAD